VVPVGAVAKASTSVQAMLVVFWAASSPSRNEEINWGVVPGQSVSPSSAGLQILDGRGPQVDAHDAVTSSGQGRASTLRAARSHRA